jgi:hypothetical protein
MGYIRAGGACDGRALGRGCGAAQPIHPRAATPLLPRPLHALHALHAGSAPAGTFLRPFATLAMSFQMTAAANACCRAMRAFCAFYIQNRVAAKIFPRTERRNAANLPNACSRVCKRGSSLSSRQRNSSGGFKGTRRPAEGSLRWSRPSFLRAVGFGVGVFGGCDRGGFKTTLSLPGQPLTLCSRADFGGL